METNIKANGFRVLLMVLEFSLTQKERNIKVIGKKMNHTGRERKIGRMEAFMKESITMDLRKVLGFRVSQMEISTRGIGKETNFMEGASSR